MIKQSYSYTDSNKGSWFQLFNPLSQVIGDTPDRVPTWTSQLPFGSDSAKYLALKTGACALLAAAVVGGGRLLQHINSIGKLREKDAPGRNLASDLNYSYALGTDTKQKKRNRFEESAAGAVTDLVSDGAKAITKSAGVVEESLPAVLPLGAMLIASGLAYKSVDGWANARKDRILSKRIDGKNRYLKQLIVARAQNAKSPLTQEELNVATTRPDFEAEPLQAKQGSLQKCSLEDNREHGVQAGIGLAAAALLAASAIASYKYAEATDPENLKFRAYKKGLHEYAAQRGKSVPLTVVPENSGLFDKIDSRASAKQQPPTFSDVRTLSL